MGQKEGGQRDILVGHWGWKSRELLPAALQDLGEGCCLQGRREEAVGGPFLAKEPQESSSSKSGRSYELGSAAPGGTGAKLGHLEGGCSPRPKAVQSG